MARAKTRSSRTRRRAHSTSRSSSFLSQLPDTLARPELLGVLLIVVALAAAPFFVPFPELWRETRDAVARHLGLGVLLWLLALAACGVLLLRGQALGWARLVRLSAGIALFTVFVWGLLGTNHADISVGSVSFREVSSGGLVGESLTTTPLGVLVYLLSIAGAAWLLAPHATLTVLRNLPRAARTVWSWNLQGKAWRGVAALYAALASRREQRPQLPEETWGEISHLPDFEEFPEFSESESPIGSGAAAAFHRGWPQAPRATMASVAAAETKPKEATPAVPLEQPAAVEGQLTLPEERSPWQLPPLELLVMPPSAKNAKMDNSARAQLIVDTLRSFGVDASVVQINEGPTVTQFGVEPGWDVKTKTVVEKDENNRPILDKEGRPKTRVEEVGRTKVRVNQITALANDLALALAAPAIRIEAPVPGKPIVGIEVPNNVASVVTLRSVMEGEAFMRMVHRSKLTIALGKGVSGEPVVADLAKMPHLLIAGATGSGKSVCINSIITGILMNASPDEVRFVMIDPKRVELAPYKDIPHLAFSEVIVDIPKVVGTLGAVLAEMESRYRLFSTMAARNIEAYNRNPRVQNKLPYWVVIIDELADLMMNAGFEVEKQICRLAQLARATGIHLIVATQRPSVDVITGLIKANFPTRIAFAVTSQVDSRTILDGVGAEKLLGRGDMLFLATDAAKPRRLQGVYVSDREIEHVVGYWTASRFREMVPERYDHLIDEAMTVQEPEPAPGGDDDLLERARELAMEHTRISASLLQRRLRIGYPRAARLIDMLEEDGLVGASEGGQSREVLLSVAEE